MNAIYSISVCVMQEHEYTALQLKYELTKCEKEEAMNTVNKLVRFV